MPPKCVKGIQAGRSEKWEALWEVKHQQEPMREPARDLSSQSVARARPDKAPVVWDSPPPPPP